MNTLAATRPAQTLPLAAPHTAAHAAPHTAPHTAAHAASHAALPAADAARPNFYVPIHKALRSFMMDTLMRVGAIDTQDARRAEPALQQLEALLSFCGEHLKHENDFVHAAMEARQPGAAARTAADHEDHAQAIDALRADAAALRSATGEAEAALKAMRLYRHLALFVAENFQHMHIEETVNAAALFALYTDAELDEIHARLIASIGPQEHLETARWMIPAMTPAERGAMVAGMKVQMPPEALLGVLHHVRPHLDADAWQQLVRIAARPQPAGPAPAR